MVQNIQSIQIKRKWRLCLKIVVQGGDNVIEVTQKRMKWSAGMLCDITDEIEAAINQDDVTKAREFITLLKEETNKLEVLMNKN